MEPDWQQLAQDFALEAHEDCFESHRGLWRILSDRGITGRDLTRWIALAASVLFTAYGLFRLFGPARHRTDPKAPPPPSI